MSGNNAKQTDTRSMSEMYNDPFTRNVNRYDLSQKETDIENGSSSWFLAGGSNNPLTATDDIEAQQAMSQGGATDALISNPNIDSSKTYSLQEAMGEVDVSAAPDSEYTMGYTASDLYYNVTGENKIGTAAGGTYTSEKTGKGENSSATKGNSNAYTMAVQDRWLQNVQSGNNTNYYIDANNKIKARKNQVTLTGYDGGVIGVQNSGVR